ncbi:putative lipid-transfer protein DIR1, partial [Mucuna pruriens]
MEAYKKVMIMGMLLGIVMIGSGPMLSNAQYSFCQMSKDGLKACLPCVSGDNPVDPPTSACCSAIAKADLECLCHFKDSTFLSFYRVDPNKAMQLPVKCKVVDSFHC